MAFKGIIYKAHRMFDLENKKNVKKNRKGVKNNLRLLGNKDNKRKQR